LALIGMSGAGKTHWSKKLEADGYRAVSCDDRIEERLAPRLAEGGYSGINGVAAWMGWPDSATYSERESQYLSDEIRVLDDVLTLLKHEVEGSLILDTTGSVIYAGNNLLYRLRKHMTVVYLAASDAERRLLIERYLSDPKPVLWRGAFVPKKGETSRDTVTRSYPILMEARRRSYEALAHVTLRVSELRDPSMDAERFLSLVRGR